MKPHPTHAHAPPTATHPAKRPSANPAEHPTANQTKHNPTTDQPDSHQATQRSTPTQTHTHTHEHASTQRRPERREQQPFPTPRGCGLEPTTRGFAVRASRQRSQRPSSQPANTANTKPTARNNQQRSQRPKPTSNHCQQTDKQSCGMSCSLCSVGLHAHTPHVPPSPGKSQRPKVTRLQHSYYHILHEHKTYP